MRQKECKPEDGDEHCEVMAIAITNWLQLLAQDQTSPKSQQRWERPPSGPNPYWGVIGNG